MKRTQGKYHLPHSTCGEDGSGKIEVVRHCPSQNLDDIRIFLNRFQEERHIKELHQKRTYKKTKRVAHSPGPC